MSKWIILFIALGVILAIVLYPTANKQDIEKKEIPTVSNLELVEKEIPEILKKIAFCESGNKQFNSDGSVIRGRQNNKDIGKYQINLYYHGDKAIELGYDLFTEQGNEDYALWLYEHQGTTPWNWSKRCWNK